MRKLKISKSKWWLEVVSKVKDKYLYKEAKVMALDIKHEFNNNESLDLVTIYYLDKNKVLCKSTFKHRNNNNFNFKNIRNILWFLKS